jgi:hypothetical protein
VGHGGAGVVRELRRECAGNRVADVMAVAGDPLADVGALKNVQFAMKDGVVFKSAAAMGHAP